jgi:hypothetical protein
MRWWILGLCIALLACSSSGDDDGNDGAAASMSPSAPAGSAGTGGQVAHSAGSGGNSGATGGSHASAGSGGTPGTVMMGTGGSSSPNTNDAAMPPISDAGATTDAGDGASEAKDTDLWIASDAADTNPGTEAMPLKSLAAAVMRAQPGMTIWVKPGTYASADTVALDSNGEETKPLRIFAAPGARPVFDFMAQPRGQSSARGFEISGTYWHLRGIDVINAGDNCIHISGSHNTIERVVTHGCSDTGLQITANGSEAGDASRAAYNSVINCDSYENYDEANQGENADGFAAKLYIGPGNSFRGCRAWNNADDGWDLFASDDVVTIEDCWAIANGKIGPSQNNTNGDGNGFKLGGAAKAGDSNMGGAVHIVSGCSSIENRACGFVRNNNTDVPQLSMCGGRGDGKGTYCSLTNGGGDVTVTMSAADAIAAKRDADGNLPPIH